MKGIIKLIIGVLTGTMLIGCRMAKNDKLIVGTDIRTEDITEFYYTKENINYNAFFLRYHFYTENGKQMFSHEKRERPGDYGPAGTEDITASGTIELRAEQQSELFRLLSGGTVTKRRESTETGDSGPWMYLYWTNDSGKIQEYTFASISAQSEFEAFCAALAESSREEPAKAGTADSADASDFVLLSDAVPDAILEIRYYSTYNFVGERIDGYEEPVALMTREAAEALREVSEDAAELGYRLKIYDAYRPQAAVSHFVRWAKDPDDTRMKAYFYPELEKDLLFPQGYILEHSGHSRGSTIDLTLFDMRTGKEADMGGTFDYFGERSHPDYTGITEEQYENRMVLRDLMTAHGFEPLAEEWWHFTLKDEPYPDTYFTFPVSAESVQNN